MRASIRVGSIFGIAIFAHFSWFLIFAIVSAALAGTYASEFAALPRELHWLLGAATSLLLFGSVLAHEMAHSLVAQRRGIRVRAITLFIFGGVAEIEEDPKQPRAEILIAIAGPLASLGLGALLGAIWYLTRAHAPVPAAMAGWLAQMNLSLGLFNLLPGLPLDGGRVLRGIVWHSTGSFARATRAASAMGRFLGWLLMATGVWLALEQHRMADGIWIGFIGWFLVRSAQGLLLQLDLQNALAGLRVSQLMNTDCAFVSPAISLREFVDAHLLQQPVEGFIVGDGVQPRGVIHAVDVQALPRETWDARSVQAAMQPIDKTPAVAPDTELLAALRLMETANLRLLPVIQHGHLVGTLARENILTLLRNRLEFPDRFQPQRQAPSNGRSRWLGA